VTDSGTGTSFDTKRIQYEVYPVFVDAPAPLSPRRAQTRARLVEAAEELFVAKGLHGTSIEQVCERAGFTRGAFYSNFASLDALLVAVHERRATLMIDTVREAVGQATGDDADPTPSSVIDAVLSRLDDDRAWHVMGVEMSLAALRDPELAARLHAERTELVAALTPVVQRALDASGYDAPLGAAVLTADLVAAYLGTADDRWLHHDRASTARVMSAVVAGSTRPRA
jgi:AcrR family transcriptional regulator